MLELNKKYKSGSATEILREAILSGDIQSGIEITQNEIATSLGTSRMPVREALIALEYQGLVERMPTQHVKVITLNEEYIRGIFTDMALLEIEAVKNLSEDKFNILGSCTEQMKFHRTIYKNIYMPLRKKFVEILTEIYLSFVLERAECIDKINAVFMNLTCAMHNNADFEIIRACYAVYSEVLSNELINIRRRRNAECKAG